MKKSALTKKRILDKTSELFNLQGFSGTHMRDIIKATGLSKGGIYGHFESKEEIAIASFRHAVGQVVEEVRKRTGVINNSLDKLKAVVYLYHERIMDPPVRGGCPILNTAVEADDYIEVLREEVLTAVDLWKKGIIRTLEKGIERGEVHPQIDTESFALRFIGMMEGGILMTRIYKDPKPFGLMAESLVELIESVRND